MPAFDVSEADFDERVLRASERVPVVVDFWAPWCAPCRSLGPVLERAVESYQGRLLLAKVNVDENPGLAAQWRVQGIPAVKVFVDGQVATEFTGALPEGEVRRILDLVAPSEADQRVKAADGLLGRGDRGAAKQALEGVLTDEPRHAGAALRLARLALDDGGTDAARELAGRVPEGSAEHAEAKALLDRFEFIDRCRATGGTAACSERAAEAPDDLGARYDLACCQAADGDHEAALESLLAIVARDKAWEDGRAKDTMVRIFAIVGQRSPLADAYREKLTSLLY